jgi:HlyB family type I secretion system ABC transporter
MSLSALTIALDIAPDHPWMETLTAQSVESIALGREIKPHLRSGLAIVLAGKVRVLAGETLVCSLCAGDILSLELEQIDRYSLRSGLGLTLLHLSPTLLTDLQKDLPQVRDRIQQKIQFHALGSASPDQLPRLAADRLVLPSNQRSAEQLSEQLSNPSFSPPSNPKPFFKSRRSKPSSNGSSNGDDRNAVQFPKPKGGMKRLFQRVVHRYPFIKQQSAVDCGVACLVMIGLYWGKRFDINQLRHLANVDRRGASLKGLVIAAEQLGFAARPVKASLDQISRQPLPAIAHWQGRHYVVVYEVTKRQVLVGDPELGRKRYSHREFMEGWTGYTVLLQPTVLLEQAPEAKKSLNRFIKLLRPHWLVLTEIVLASLLIQVFGLVTPLLTQLLLDRVVVQRSGTTLIAIGSGLMIFSFFRIVLTSLRQYLLYHTANRIDVSLVVGFISHALRLRLSYFETRYVGDITSRIAENQKIRRFITGDAITTLLDLVMVFVYIGLMVWYSWQMAVLALAMVPLLFLVTLVSTPFLRQVSRAEFLARTQESSYLIEALTGIGTVKSMGLERRVRWRWEALFTKAIKLNFSGRVIRERMRFASSLVETGVSRSLLLFGIWLVINDQLTIGQLMAFNMLLGNVITPFMRLIDLWDDFQEVLISVERLNDVLDSPAEESGGAGESLIHLPTIAGSIRFENVTFRYNLESPTNTLENLSFEVQAGQTVALVGRSGSGKTTISKLLLGLYLPTDGKIFVDGYDLATVSMRSLRQQVGVVDQNTFLFGGTIRENLTVGHPEATQSQLSESVRLAGADVFIDQLPMRYDSAIGEGGGMLSGGQRQRLAIARALLGKPRLLILDEATSSLDAETERLIQDNFNRISHQQTTLIIAHRLSTVRNADLILVLDQGVLIESGTHEALMKKRGQYYALNQQQLTIG